MSRAFTIGDRVIHGSKDLVGTVRGMCIVRCGLNKQAESLLVHWDGEQEPREVWAHDVYKYPEGGAEEE